MELVSGKSMRKEQVPVKAMQSIWRFGKFQTARLIALLWSS